MEVGGSRLQAFLSPPVGQERQRAWWYKVALLFALNSGEPGDSMYEFPILRIVLSDGFYTYFQEKETRQYTANRTRTRNLAIQNTNK